MNEADDLMSNPVNWQSANILAIRAVLTLHIADKPLTDAAIGRQLKALVRSTAPGASDMLLLAGSIAADIAAITGFMSGSSRS